jgi:tetratricopeptide (TPR) repeat protein
MALNRKWILLALAAFVLAVLNVPPVEAREPNIAAGIQYVIQGTRDERGRPSFEASRQLLESAITSLNKGLANDPRDGEAWLYLGRAYGELDSVEQCGHALDEAIACLSDNPKVLKRAQDHRICFFAKYYNDGLAKLALAEAGFRRALLINKTKAVAYDNLATVLELQGKFADAGLVVETGLANAVPKEGEEYERLLKRKSR